MRDDDRRDDDIDASQAPLIEHLTELRDRLMRSLIALVICIVICFFFSRDIFQFLSAPLSEGRLDGCTLHCPLHRGSFDARDGEVVTFPTTGGLTAEGEYRPTWSPADDRPKPPLPADDPKARARALTRVRRLRYYPLRISGPTLEIALPR